MRSLIVVALLVLLTSQASAHPLAPALLDVHEHDDHVADVTWKIPVLRPTGESLVPILPANCRPLEAPELARDDTRLVQRWRVTCPTGWVGETIAMRGLATATTAALIRVTSADGHVVTALLSSEHPSFTVPARPTAVTVLREYLVLGVEHLLTGLDHLLFVLALVFLVRRGRPLVTTITAFTLGHSLTLSLAVLGIVALPVAPIEAAITGSIVVLAAELAAARKGRAGALSRRPWIAALAFGLLHGFGFAGALAAIGVPAGEIPLALLAFNVGIELGQLAVVALVLAALAIARRTALGVPHWLRLAPAYGIGSVAALWFFERLEPLVQIVAR